MSNSLGIPTLLALGVVMVVMVGASQFMATVQQTSLEAVRAEEVSARPSPEIERHRRYAGLGPDTPEDYLLDRLRHGDGPLRERAIVRLRRHHTPAALEATLAALNDPMREVRWTAIDALLEWPSDDVAVALMNVVQMERDNGNRCHAIEILHQFPPNRRILSFLGEIVDHPDFSIRVVTFAGLNKYARSMPAECRAVCLRRLGTSSEETVKKLTRLLLDNFYTEAETRQQLIQVMRQGNDAVTSEAFALLSSEENPGDAQVMIHALDKCGDRYMAECLLNSEHPQMEAAARNWAAKHGVAIVEWPPRPVDLDQVRNSQPREEKEEKNRIREFREKRRKS